MPHPLPYCWVSYGSNSGKVCSEELQLWENALSSRSIQKIIHEHTRQLQGCRIIQASVGNALKLGSPWIASRLCWSTINPYSVVSDPGIPSRTLRLASEPKYKSVVSSPSSSLCLCFADCFNCLVSDSWDWSPLSCATRALVQTDNAEWVRARHRHSVPSWRTTRCWTYLLEALKKEVPFAAFSSTSFRIFGIMNGTQTVS